MYDEDGRVDVRPMTPADWDRVSAIYAEGIRTGHATFESQPPDWLSFDATKLSGPRHVAVLGGTLIGWAAVSPVSSRTVYAGVVEDSIYVTAGAAGHGVGTALLGAVIRSTEAAGIWTIQAGIFPENVASLRLHQRSGFRIVGMRERVGRMTYGPLKDAWRDVVLMERRSPVVGVPAGGRDG